MSVLPDRPEVLLSSGEAWSELELDDVRLAPQIDKILNDTQWVDDANGLIPHCIAILKLCHQMTERLVATTMSPIHSDRLHDIIEVGVAVIVKVVVAVVVVEIIICSCRSSRSSSSSTSSIFFIKLVIALKLSFVMEVVYIVV